MIDASVGASSRCSSSEFTSAGMELRIVPSGFGLARLDGAIDGKVTGDSLEGRVGMASGGWTSGPLKPMVGCRCLPPNVGLCAEKPPRPDRTVDISLSDMLRCCPELGRPPMGVAMSVTFKDPASCEVAAGADIDTGSFRGGVLARIFGCRSRQARECGTVSRCSVESWSLSPCAPSLSPWILALLPANLRFPGMLPRLGPLATPR